MSQHAASRFAYLEEDASGLVLLHRTTGEVEELRQFSTLEDALGNIPGTPQAQELGIPSARIIRLLTPAGVIVVDFEITAPCGVQVPGERRWRPAIAFVESSLAPIPLALPPKPAQLEAEDCAHNALNDGLLAAAHDALPARGLLNALHLRRADKRD